MIRIKRLYIFVLGTFLPLLLATFSVVLFILLMQFLWQFVNDMVGKGVGMGVLAELFFYASLSSIPMALPLAVLLASLMTFGNLAEHLELLAMKASGISLIRIMKPLIFFSILIAGFSFFFQNNIVPGAKTKMYTIVVSLKQKSPALDIPEGSFYKEIPGYNVYVRHKDKKNGTLRDLMIYDYSRGFENAVVIVADSGELSVSTDKKYLILTLYNGESFENLETRKTRNLTEKIPYRRETFSLRKTLISFDTNFNRMDESVMGGRDMGKNIRELTSFIDSVKQTQDSLNRGSVYYLKKNTYINAFKEPVNTLSSSNNTKNDSLFARGFKNYFNNLSLDDKIRYLQQAKNKVEQVKPDYTASVWQSENGKQLRSHSVQLHQKFSLALSCLLFFFIGAPLGAIIRKGGLGMPAVISVFLFLLYYITDTFGTKLAKQGVWTVWEGVWLSSTVLAALGAFFTYKAVNDSTALNPDAWKIFIQKLFGKRELRFYAKKEVIINLPNYSENIKNIKIWNQTCEEYLNTHTQIPSYISFWKKTLFDSNLNRLIESMESVIEDLLNSDENFIIYKLMDYPIIQPFRWNFTENPAIRTCCRFIFPIGLVFYFIAVFKQKQMNKDLIISCNLNKTLLVEIEKQNEK
jgi:lipopolysaccharide export system permease protein